MTETPDSTGERTVLRPTTQYGPSSALSASSAASASSPVTPPALDEERAHPVEAEDQDAEATHIETFSDKLKVGAATVGVAAGVAAARAKDGTRKFGEALREVTKPNPSAASGGRTVTRERRTRKARLRISRVDPWSVMKTALLFGLAGGIMFVIATFVVMNVVESTGLFDSINKAVRDVLFTQGDDSFRIEQYVNTRRVTGFAALIGAVDVVIFTALATVFAFLYNLSATMLGGLEITLAED